MDTWGGKACTPITLNKYLYGDDDPILNVDPSGNATLADLMAAVNSRATQSTSAQASYRVALRKAGKKFACIAIEEVASEVVMSQLTGGIYVLLDGTQKYIGRTSNFDRRLAEHAKDVTKNISKTLARFHMAPGRNNMRVVEQFFIELFRDTYGENISNKFNSVADRPRSLNSQRLRKMIDKLKLCD